MKGDPSIPVPLGPEVAMDRLLLTDLAEMAPLIMRLDGQAPLRRHRVLSQTAKKDHAHLVKQKRTATSNFPVHGSSSQFTFLIISPSRSPLLDRKAR